MSRNGAIYVLIIEKHSLRPFSIGSDIGLKFSAKCLHTALKKLLIYKRRRRVATRAGRAVEILKGTGKNKKQRIYFCLINPFCGCGAQL